MTTIDTVLEKWESNTQATVYVNKFDPARPGRFKQERVRPGRSFLITPEERNLLNSDRTIEEVNDPFKNGMLRPVKGDAVAAAREAEVAAQQQAMAEAAPNPNHMSDAELSALFEIRNFPQFKKALGDISSVAVLSRLRQLAEVEDNNATVSMVNLIDTMIGDMRAQEGSTEVIPVNQEFRVGGLAGDADDRSGLQPFKI